MMSLFQYYNITWIISDSSWWNNMLKSMDYDKSSGKVLYIKEHSWFTKSHWSVVEQLPLVVYDGIPMIDELFFAVYICI